MTFSHEFGDGLIKNLFAKEAIVEHRVLLHVLEGRHLHSVVDDIVREVQVEVLHDSFNFTSGILGFGTKKRTIMSRIERCRASPAPAEALLTDSKSDATAT